MDLAAKQKQRRQLRMEILKRKRQRKGGDSNSSPISIMPVMVDLSSPASSMFESGLSTPALDAEITDPKLLRKLRNRESAARSRQKLLDLIDSLTCELCDRYVTYQDLEEQMNYLNNNVEPMPSYRAGLSQYPSLDNLILWENDLDSISNDDYCVSPCQSPISFKNFQQPQLQTTVIQSQSLNDLMEFFLPVDPVGGGYSSYSCVEPDSFAQDYLDYLLI